MKFGRNVLPVNTHRLTWSQFFDLTSHLQDAGRDVIPRKKVLPPGECIRSVCWRLCSCVSQFLVCSTFVLAVKNT